MVWSKLVIIIYITAKSVVYFLLHMMQVGKLVT